MDKEQYTEILNATKTFSPLSELVAMKDYNEITDLKVLTIITDLQNIDELFDETIAKLIDYCAKEVHGS